METLLSLVKARLGISHVQRDPYLTAIISSVKKELTDEKGLLIDEKNQYHQMFIVDYASWRYENRDSHEGIPRHLQFRLHNLMIHNGGDASV